MAEVVDIRRLPHGGFAMVVRCSNGKIVNLNFTRRHFEKLTADEVKRLLQEVEEQYGSDTIPQEIYSKIQQFKGMKA